MSPSQANNAQLLEPLRLWANDWACDCTPKMRVFAAALCTLFNRFLLDQIRSHRSPNTIRRHRNELYTLGYECIRSLAIVDPCRPPADARSYLATLYLDQGGPLLSLRSATMRDQA